MSTRSIIGALIDDGEVGFYCHLDGYPMWMAVRLQGLVKRDGCRKVVTTLLAQDRGGWSRIHPDIRRGRSVRGRRLAVVAGYGVAYRDVDPEPPIRIQDVLGNVFIEFAYFVHPDGRIRAYCLHVDGTAHRWFIGPDDTVDIGVPLDAELVSAADFDRPGS